MKWLRKLRRPADVDLFRLVRISGVTFRVTSVRFDRDGAYIELVENNRWGARHDV